jgi:hypothetical protein
MFKNFWNDTILPFWYMITALIHNNKQISKPDEKETGD